ncbi:MAG: ribbon-helix-helix domain-containing protein [Nitrospirae bacterium]|nr:ribbon-helix-helix domain-containing protein [Nitrospirota bacterium]
MVKATFTFDDETFGSLRRTAERLRIPQSQVVREAVRSYAERSRTLPEEERRRKLRILDTILDRRANKTTSHVDDELRTLGRSRQGYGRKHRAD